MTFLSRITRAPRPFRKDATPDAPSGAQDLLRGTIGCSPYLASLINKETAFLEGLWHRTPEDMLADLLQETQTVPTASTAADLRRLKGQVALLTALADLGGVWSVMQVTSALTQFADAATDRAMRAGLEPLLIRGKIPGQTLDALPDCAGMTALAMGKMGAGELNYSSDIDLICLFDETRHDPDDYGEVRAGFIKATRAAMKLLSDVTGDGYVFRTDLRLRPDPSVTPVCLSMEAAERYYEALGRTWERAAHIKARACAGDTDAGAAYLDRLTPFVYRRHLDFAAIEDAHNIRLKIREHKGLGGALDLMGHDLKLGRGGIREIEFFTQTRQLIAGGRDPDLRDRRTLQSLDMLHQKGWIPQEASAQLSDHYCRFREIEHRLQMVQDAQTHRLPPSNEEWDRLAAFCDIDRKDLEAELTGRIRETEALTEDFFAPDAKSVDPTPEVFGEQALALTERWTTYPALRSERGQALFDRLRPDILKCLARAAIPDEALTAFDGFLAGLPAGVQLFSMFAANPQLIDLIVDICATAPDLAQYLARHASVFDAVIGGDFFEPLPMRGALRADLSKGLLDAGDYEAQLNAARRWQKEQHFRIGVHFLRGKISAEETGTRYADLAEATLQALWPVVCAEFARKHGHVAGMGAAIVAMGSLGARRLSARSDLDLIVIYDAEAEASDGPRPLQARPYFARLTQALITALSAPTGEGRLYEVDMRLRPSGNKGPVATSLASFEQYQRNEAWVWEHLALTRARVIVGLPILQDRIETLRCDLLQSSRFDADEVRAALRDMRARFVSAGRTGVDYAPKEGPGRMQEIELLAQGNALVMGQSKRALRAQLGAGGLVTPAQAETLQQSYALLSEYQQALRLLTDGTPDPNDLARGAQAFVTRVTGSASLSDLCMALRGRPKGADAVITSVLE